VRESEREGSRVRLYCVRDGSKGERHAAVCASVGFGLRLCGYFVALAPWRSWRVFVRIGCGVCVCEGARVQRNFSQYTRSRLARSNLNTGSAGICNSRAYLPSSQSARARPVGSATAIPYRYDRSPHDGPLRRLSIYLSTTSDNVIRSGLDRCTYACTCHTGSRLGARASPTAHTHTHTVGTSSGQHGIERSAHGGFGAHGASSPQ